MYEQFTHRARRVMQLANRESHRFNHEYIGTEHILLGLVKEGDGVAANVLKMLDVSLDKIRAEVEKIVQHGPGGAPFPPAARPSLLGRLFAFFTGAVAVPDVGPPLTPTAKRAIEYSIEEARQLKHNYVGTEHLLLGLLRETEGVAAQVLINLGLNLQGVRDEVLNFLRGP